MTVHDYLAPWMRGRGVNVPTNPVQVQPARTGFTPPPPAGLLADPGLCCKACADLTALIGELRDGPDLDAAAAAHGCTRSPITARRVTRPPAPAGAP